MSTSPPRLLTGAALLFWGYLTGHILPALIAAILLEARPLLGIRWDFKRESYVKAWQFSILCSAFIAIVSWINGMNAGKIHTIFVWAPFILLPLELAQRYGNADKIPLNTFSFFARRKMQQDMDQGRSISPRMINTGYPYIAIIVMATAKASHHELHHFIGLSLLIGACLYAYMKKDGFRRSAWICAFLLVITFSYIGQWGMFKLYRYYRGGAETTQISPHSSSNEAKTKIGKLGQLKLSPRIFWRMQVKEGTTPKLLRYATYNHYSSARWTYKFNSPADADYDESGYKSYLSAAVTTEDDRDIRWFTKEQPKLTISAPITLIGEVDARVEEHPLPLPHHFLAIGDLDKEAYIECNTLGTVRMANPNYNVVEYSLWLGDFPNTEEPPGQELNQKNLDLSIPWQEKDALQRICNQLDLYNDNLNTYEKIRKLRDFFNSEFKYTTHLTTPRFDRGRRDASISIFLETSRKGHCEYFATATALLLREANIPTRYCTGFSVNERNPDQDEWVMRGQHAHAWCRVWIEEKNSSGKLTGHWEDVDLTPASWLSMDLGNTGIWKQKLADWWQRIREDFLIWRTRETNKTKVYVVIAGIIIVLAIWIFWRLWHSRKRRIHSKLNRYQRPEDCPVTPLHKLEYLAAKKIGPRPEGTPLCEWMRGIVSLDNPHQNELKKLLSPAISLHSIIRFDPAGAAPSQHQKLTELCTNLKKAIKKIPS